MACLQTKQLKVIGLIRRIFKKRKKGGKKMALKKEKNVNEMSVIELKAVCFDLEQEINFKQNQLQSVFKILQNKISEKQTEVDTDGDKKD
jgi:hypothetical protein